MRKQDIDNSTIEIPMGKGKGKAKNRIPVILYHSLRGRELDKDGNIRGYRLSPKELELELMFPNGCPDGVVWLSLSPYSEHAIAIDARKLDSNNLRFTGQSEGFVIHKGSIPAAAIVPEKSELDESLDLFSLSSEPEKLTGYQNRDEIPALAWEKYQHNPEELRKREYLWAQDADMAFNYAYAVLDAPFPAGEAAIAKNPDLSYLYALNILKAPFPEGEPAIATRSHWAWWYTTQILNNTRFLIAEKTIATDAAYAYLYCERILKKTFRTSKEAQDYLNSVAGQELTEALNLYGLTNKPEELTGHEQADEVPEIAWEKYGRDFESLTPHERKIAIPKLKAREPVFAKDPRIACLYATNVLHRPFPLGEPVIRKNPKFAALYAVEVLGYRWTEAEPIILTDLEAIFDYMVGLNYDWPEGKKKIYTDPKLTYELVSITTAEGSRRVDAEPVIMSNPRTAYLYASWFIRGPWPEAEENISTDPVYAALYVNNVLKYEGDFTRYSVACQKFLKKRAKARKEGNLEETLNLFNLHDNPQDLKDYDKSNLIPQIEWEKYKDYPEDLPKFEHIWAKDPTTACDYAYRINQRFPAGESVIAQDPAESFYYARDIIGGQWPQGESAISKDPLTSLYYSRLIEKPFLAGEKAIARDDYLPYTYVSEILKIHDLSEIQSREFLKRRIASRANKKKIKEALDLFNLHSDPKNLQNYDKAEQVPKLMWVRLYGKYKESIDNHFNMYWRNGGALNTEEMIEKFNAVRKEMARYEHLWAQDPELAYMYALYILTGPFPEGEPIIAQDAHWALYYVRNVLGGRRFPAAEEAILNDKIIDTTTIIQQPGLCALAYLKNIGVDTEKELKKLGNRNIGEKWDQYRLAKRYLKNLMRRKPVTEVLNLFKLHSDPTKLNHIDKEEQIPEILWAKMYKRAVGGARTRMINQLREKEHVWAMDPETAASYATYVLKSRFPAGEPVILKDANIAALYAVDLLDGRWLEAEPNIIKNARIEWIFDYFTTFFKNEEWPEAEYRFIEKPRWAVRYALECNKERWPEAELNILNHHDATVAYVHQVLKKDYQEENAVKYLAKLVANSNKTNEGIDLFKLHSNPDALTHSDEREQVPEILWKKLTSEHKGRLYTSNIDTLMKYEDVWAKDPNTAYQYAFHISRRFIPPGFPKGEAAIATDPVTSYMYAHFVLDDKRFPAGEPAIATDPARSYWYAHNVIGGPWPMGEPIIATDADRSVHYALNVLKGRFPAGEKEIIKEQRSALAYVFFLMGKRSPSFMNFADAVKYIKQLPKVKVDETLNLFKLHNKPKELANYDKRDQLPSVVWDKLSKKYYDDEPFVKAAKEYEYLWAMESDYAHAYAARTGKPFPEGEPAILTDAYTACNYARKILKKRWVEAEPIIAENALLATIYIRTFWPGMWYDSENYQTGAWFQQFLKDEYNKAVAKKLAEDVKFDNQVGLGQTPNNADVDYFGAVVYVKPSVFLKLASNLPRDEATSVDFIKGIIKNGKPISNPTFYVYIPDEWRDGNFIGLPRIYMHEGRNRMYAIKELEGDVPVPVHIFLKSAHKEWKAKHFTPELIAALNKQIEREADPAGNSTGVLKGPWFTTNV